MFFLCVQNGKRCSDYCAVSPEIFDLIALEINDCKNGKRSRRPNLAIALLLITNNCYCKIKFL